MLETLITSKTRIKLLVKFFLNPDLKGYLRGLESEFKESSNAVRVELNRFEKAGLLVSNKEGNRKFFSANQQHPLFEQINHLVNRHIGIDQIVETISAKAGGIQKVFLTGELANGLNSDTIEMILIANSVDKDYISSLTEKAETIIKKKIICHIYSPENFEQSDKSNPSLFLIWTS